LLQWKGTRVKSQLFNEEFTRKSAKCGTLQSKLACESRGVALRHLSGSEVN